MKLTETQKNFRKQMKQYEKNNDNMSNTPYDNPTSKSSKGQGSELFITVILGLLIIAGAYAIKNNGALPIANSNSGKSVSDQVNNKIAQNQVAEKTEAAFAGIGSPENYLAGNDITSTYTGSRVLTNREGQALKSLIQCTKAVTEAAESVSAFNEIKAGRDNAQYRKALMAAIAVCIEQERQIASCYVPEQFESIQNLFLTAVSLQRNAYNCWYDASLTNDFTLIERGNSYMIQANNTVRQQMDELENYLETNGYKYSRSEDEVQFWYRSQ